MGRRTFAVVYAGCGRVSVCDTQVFATGATESRRKALY